MPDAAAPPLLELDAVSKSFGRVVVADRLSLTVGTGDVVGMVGPNGAGKTSLFGLISGTLDPETAAMAKWWATDKQCEIIDDCVQLHGGYGYMLEYPVARMWTDGRIQKIWGGSNEVMKDLIARAL